MFVAVVAVVAIAIRMEKKYGETGERASEKWTKKKAFSSIGDVLYVLLHAMHNC